MRSESENSSPLSPWKGFSIGVVCLAVPVAVIAWWIYVAETTMGSQSFKVAQFLDPFPSFLRDAQMLTRIQLVFIGSAFFLFYRELKREAIPKVLIVFMLSISSLIGLWLLFTMM